MVHLVGGTTRIWTYRATGIVPAGYPAEALPGLEGVIRSAVAWNDTMLPWLRGTDVQQEELTDKQVQEMMADFSARLQGH